MPPWLQFLLASEGSKMVVPRTSYGVPKPVSKTQVPDISGPKSGFQRPTSEGYKIPKNYNPYEKDLGIRGQIGPAMEIPMYMMPQHLSS